MQTLTASPTSTPSASSSFSPPPQSSGDNDEDDETGPSAAKKWGPIVGGVTGGIIFLVLLFFFLRRVFRRKKDSHSPSIVKHETTRAPTREGRRSEGSFLGLWTRDRDMKRQTEFIIDPKSFATPRPAPRPIRTSGPVSTAGGPGGPRGPSRLRKGTSSRLYVRNDVSDGESETTLVPPTRDGGDDSIQVHTRRPDAGTPRTPRTPRTARQDFSQPRSYSSHTLPSLYDPPTGAPTYRGTTYSGYTEGTAMTGGVSPTSDYPHTERYSRASSQGEYWSKQALPPLPTGQGGVGKNRKK